jgi:hypothetical protein
MDPIRPTEVLIGVILVFIFTILVLLVAPKLSLYAVAAIALLAAAALTPVLTGRLPRR